MLYIVQTNSVCVCVTYHSHRLRDNLIQFTFIQSICSMYVLVSLKPLECPDAKATSIRISHEIFTQPMMSPLRLLYFSTYKDSKSAKEVLEVAIVDYFSE